MAAKIKTSMRECYPAPGRKESSNGLMNRHKVDSVGKMRDLGENDVPVKFFEEITPGDAALNTSFRDLQPIKGLGKTSSSPSRPKESINSSFMNPIKGGKK